MFRSRNFRKWDQGSGVYATSLCGREPFDIPVHEVVGNEIVSQNLDASLHPFDQVSLFYDQMQ